MLRRTIKFPNSSAGLRCACCKTDQCSFLKDNEYQKAPLQHWLNENSADSNVSSPPQPTAADSSPVPPNSAGRRIKVVRMPPPTTPRSLASSPQLNSGFVSDSSSTLSTAPSASTGSDAHSPTTSTSGEHSHLKRLRSHGESLLDGTPNAKAARLDATAATATTSTTEELVDQYQGQDPEFGQHMLGLLLRHDTILKTQRTALSTVEELKQENKREKKEKEALLLQQSESKKNHAALVKDRTAATLLAEDRAAEMACFIKERDEAKTILVDISSQLKGALEREASLLEKEKKREREKTVAKEAISAATKRESEAKDITIKGLENQLAKEERQHDLAVKNADASRHARNEAQNALAVIQADKDQLTRELETMTANHENVAIDLEETRVSLERAQADSAHLKDVKAELVTVRSEVQQLSSVNAQLSTSAEAIKDLDKKLENMRNVAQDNLDDKNQLEVRLHDARAEAVEWKQKGEEFRKNLNVAVGNLLKSEMKLKELKRDKQEVKRDKQEVKREESGEGQAEGSRAKRDIIDMTGA